MSHMDDADYRERAKMWHTFTRLSTWAVVIVVVILVGMALTLLERGILTMSAAFTRRGRSA